jgi:adenosine kinase
MARPCRRIPQGLLGKKTIGIIAPGNLSDMLAYAGQYRRTKTRYFFDPGQQTTILNGSQFRKCLNGAYGFISNDYELSLALKKTGWTFARLLQTVTIVVTTLGAKGSRIFTAGKKVIIPPAKPKNSSDPTGAGDAYRAGFVKGLQLGLPLEQCGRLGAVVSVYSVETYGTQTHQFTWKDIKKRYYRNFKERL